MQGNSTNTNCIRILYAKEHENCPNNDNRQRPAIEERFMEEGEVWEVQPWVNKIIFVLEGEVKYSIGMIEQYYVHQGQTFFLPANNSMSCNALGKTRLGIIRLYNKIQFCDSFHLEDLERMDIEEVQKDKPFLLEINPVMEKFVDILTICHRAGLRCRYYNEGKIKELMFILRAFYPKEDLRRFFAPALSTDTHFSQFIISNYNKYTNLTDFAQAMNYTVSGFEKKFRKVFSCSPYNWIRKQRAQDAYHYLNTSDMNLKQISDMFGFNSVAAFNKFIRQHFGMPPGQIRKNKRKAEMDNKPA